MRLEWTSGERVGVAIATMQKIFNETGIVPAELVRVYKEILKRSKQSIIATFWEILATKAPELLKVFTENDETAGETECSTKA